MVTLSRPGKPVVRGLPGVLLAGALLALAACGGVVAGPGGGQQTPAVSSSVQAATVCASTTRLDRLVVSLSAGVESPGHPGAVLPGGITIRDPAKVRAVAAALCSLPAMPKAPMPCPADLGGSYRLTFSAAGQGFPVITARSTGCRSVSGLGPARRATAAFWALLHKELGTTGVRARPTTVPAVP